MITQQVIDGRQASIVHLDSEFEPTSAEDAVVLKIIFEDGETLFLTTPPGEEEPPKPRDAKAEFATTQKAWIEALNKDKMGYHLGFKPSKLRFLPDLDQWNAHYDYDHDEIGVQAKFHQKDYNDKVQTFLHELGHRGQARDPKAYDLYRKLGLDTEANFLEMANAEHREDAAKNGPHDKTPEAFAESYARWCLDLLMPKDLRVFWDEQYRGKTNDAQVTHMRRVKKNQFGGTTNGTLCNRMQGYGDLNSTDDPNKVTCKLCKRELVWREKRGLKL